jgi:NAD+ diphosphatase
MILAAPDLFTALVNPPVDRDGPALWFAFQGAQMLVLRDDAGARLPSAAHPDELGLVTTRSQYLGVLSGQHCFACELREDAAPPTGMQLSGLRALFGAIDDSLFALAGRAFQIVDWDRSHQFCGRCGSPTRHRANERARECPGCGQVHYPRIAPAVMALVRRGRELLLARSPHFPPGMYSALAGFVEPGETLEQTLVREVKEEVGVDVTNLRYFASQPWPFPHSLMIAFYADYAGGEITPDPSEIEAAGWFTPEALPQALPGKISISRRLIDSALKELGTDI